MEWKDKTKRSAFAVILALTLIFSTQMQIAAPAINAESSVPVILPAEAADENQPDGRNTELPKELSIIASPEELAEIYSSTNTAVMSDLTPSLSAEDILPAPAADDITVIADDDNNGENTEREGVTIVPATVNNVIRDSLPSIISTKIYTFSVSERGAIIYAFNHIINTENDCLWYITLFEEYSPDGTGKNIAYREINRMTYSSVGTSIQSPALGILPGNYRLSVKCISGYTNERYDLAIGFAQADDYETECNDTQARYTELPLNKTINGSASSFTGDKYDTDWYMFEITDTGYAVLYFNHELDSKNTSASVAWRIRLIDEQGNEYFYTNSAMDTQMLSSGVMGLSPGFYFVTVYSHVFTDVSYSLNVSFTKDDSIERELNDTPATATPIHVNTEIVGSLTERDAVSDRDYYSFTMENDGFIVIDFIHEALSTQHDGWNITITDENGVTAYSTVSDWTQDIFQSPNIGLPAGNYFIRIDSDNLYRNSIVYRLILLTVQDGTWESEPNNTPETADELILGTPINGTLVEIGVNFDIDYFRLDIETDGELTVSFGHILTDEANREGWIVSLLDADGNTVASSTSDWDSEEITFSADVQSGRYYIVIETGLFFNNSRYILTAQMQ